MSLTPQRKESYTIKYYGAHIYSIERANTTNTITFSDFSSDENLKKAVLIKQSDGSEVTCTVSLNVVTITGAASLEDLVAMIFGRLA